MRWIICYDASKSILINIQLDIQLSLIQVELLTNTHRFLHEVPPTLLHVWLTLSNTEPPYWNAILSSSLVTWFRILPHKESKVDFNVKHSPDQTCRINSISQWSTLISYHILHTKQRWKMHKLNKILSYQNINCEVSITNYNLNIVRLCLAAIAIHFLMLYIFSISYQCQRFHWILPAPPLYAV